MNINSTSGYSYGSAASKGISGLVSGLDTESQVKELLSGTQSKIDAQQALKTQTEWKQEIYRDLITQINTFQNSYFSSSSPTSLTTSALYNTMSATTEAKNFKVTASTSAPVGDTSLVVHQLAANYKMSSAAAVSGKLAGTMDPQTLQKLVDDQRNGEKKLAFKVDDKTVTIDLKEFFVKDDTFVEKIDTDAIAQKIQDELKNQANLEAKVSMVGGQLSIESSDGDRSLSVDSSSSEQALSAFGLTTSSEAKPNRTGSKRTLTSKLNLTPSLRFSMTLDDGLQKDIALDVRKLVGADGKTVDNAKVRDTLAQTFDEQFGKDVVRVSLTNGTQLEFSATIAGRKLTVNKNGSSEVLTALGMKNGQSNRIAAYNTLKEMQVSTPLQGNRFRFEINGAQFSFSEDDDIDYVMSTINSSTAGVTVVYKPLEDKFVMTANDAGAGRQIRMEQTEGNLLNVMFGSGAGDLKTGSTAASAAYTNGKLDAVTGPLLKEGDGVSPGELDGITSGTFALTVNGKEYNIEIAKETGADGKLKNYTLDGLLEKINAELAGKLGVTGETRTGENGETEDIPNIELVKGEDNKVSIVVRNGAAVEVAGLKATTDDEWKKAAQDGNLAAALGLVKDSKKLNNVVDGNMTLKAAGLESLADALKAADSTLTIDENTKLNDLKTATAGKNIEVSFEDGRFVVKSNDTSGNGVDFKLNNPEQMKLLFGAETLSLGKPAGLAATVEQGRNAIVNIDGMLTERNSNVFTYNGMTVELTGVSKLAENGSTMKGTVQVLNENGKYGSPGSLPSDPNASWGKGRWLDADGYLRQGTKQADGSYVYSATDKYMTAGEYLDGTRPSLTDTPNEFTRHYAQMIIRDENGNQLNGVGIAPDGEGGYTILSGSGVPMQERQTDTISVTRDTDKLVDGIKGFIDEYNKLVKTIGDYLNEDANYRDYAPLTDEQRAEMSEKQIELWEEKAKQGLLRRDSILDGFLQSMRTIWYETNSSGYAIYQLGIETGEWSTRGQLTMSVDGEATLRQLLTSDPTGVMNFFANTVDGAAVRVNDVIREVANTSSGSPGTLVQMAGIKGKASEKNNTLYEKIESIDERIEKLKDQYEREKERYWNQFNTMEQLISNMNTQSAWLTQQFSY